MKRTVPSGRSSRVLATLGSPTGTGRRTFRWWIDRQSHHYHHRRHYWPVAGVVFAVEVVAVVVAAFAAEDVMVVVVMSRVQRSLMDSNPNRPLTDDFDYYGIR